MLVSKIYESHIIFVTVLFQTILIIVTFLQTKILFIPIIYLPSAEILFWVVADKIFKRLRSNLLQKIFNSLLFTL